MKITLNKPQRGVVEAVLAYQYESPDSQGQDEGIDGTYWWSDWTSDAYCHEGTDCWAEEGAGGCSLQSDGTDQWC